MSLIDTTKLHNVKEMAPLHPLRTHPLSRFAFRPAEVLNKLLRN
jgi:hypothetical protein